MGAADERVARRVLAFEDQALLSRLEIRVHDGAAVADPGEELTVVLADEDVDLTAARKTHLERLVVGDPVGEQPRLAPAKHRLARFVDVGFNAAAADAAAHLTRLGHDEL